MIKSHSQKAATITAATLCVTTLAHAANRWWDGGTGNWSTTTKWSTVANAATPDPGTIPGSADDLTFNITTANASGNTVSFANGNRSARSITFDTSGNTNFRGGGNSSVNVTLTLGSGGITLNSNSGNVVIGQGPISSFGRIRVVLGASQTWTNHSTTNTLTVEDIISGSGFEITKEGVGTIILNGANTYTGATNVNGGTLLINGATSTSSAVTVGVNGTLGGSGTVGGAATVNGTLAPGQSPGEMTFANTLALAGSTVMEIDGVAGAGVAGGHDFVNLTGAGAAGTLTYGGTMTLDIGTVFTTGIYSWNLFDFATESGGFSGISLADQYAGTLTDGGGGVWGLVDGINAWSFTESDGVLSLTVIPEPTAALLGGFGLLALFRRRRN